MPTISVIVPVYKVEPYLCRCVDSVLAQSYHDYELILVDDGSPDKCGKICDEYAMKDNRIHVIHQKNGGLSAARNAGIDWVFLNSNSQWLALIDSDDWVHPNYLEAMYCAAEQHDVRICCCKLHEVYEDDVVVQPVQRKAWISERKAPEDIHISPDGSRVYSYIGRFLMHRSLFENIRFPIGKLWEDISTIPKLIYQTETVAQVDGALYYYFRRSGSITKSKWNVRHLDKLYELEKCLEYCEHASTEKICICAANELLWNLDDQYTLMYFSELSADTKKHYQQELISMLRKSLKKYGKKVNLPYAVRVGMYIKMHPVLYSAYVMGDKIRAIVSERIEFLIKRSR